MKPLISIIVPVYNVEKYINYCIDSIVNQTYRNIEVIIVDDGSTDDSLKICNLYTQKDKRVKTFHKENGGLSDARNFGLEQSIGEYILFIDSDDFWTDNNQLELLINTLNYHPNYDFIGFNCMYYYPSMNKYVRWPMYSNCITQEINKEKIICGLIKSGVFPMSACLKLIKRDFLKKNGIKFIYGITHEDIPWFIELLDKSEKIKFVNQYMYAYRKEQVNSLSSSFSEKKYNDLFNIMSNGVKSVSDTSRTNNIKNALLSFWAYEWITLLAKTNFFSKNIRSIRQRELNEYAWLLQYQLNPKVRYASFLYKLFGTKISSFILYLYLKTRL